MSLLSILSLLISVDRGTEVQCTLPWKRRGLWAVLSCSPCNKASQLSSTPVLVLYTDGGPDHSFTGKKEKNGKKPWLTHVYLWCSFAGVALSRQVSRCICERHFLWRPNWVPALCSKVPTHMYIVLVLCQKVMLQLSIICSVLGAHKTQYTEIRTSTLFLLLSTFLYFYLFLSTSFVLVFTSRSFLH